MTRALAAKITAAFVAGLLVGAAGLAYGNTRPDPVATRAVPTSAASMHASAVAKERSMAQWSSAVTTPSAVPRHHNGTHPSQSKRMQARARNAAHHATEMHARMHVTTAVQMGTRHHAETHHAGAWTTAGGTAGSGHDGGGCGR